MTDMDEFFELAVADHGDELHGSILDAAPRSPEQAAKSNGQIPAGRLSQYADLGEGYIATANTIKALPADCYTLGMTNDGSVIYARQKLVTDKLLRLPDSRSEEVIAEIEKFWTLRGRFKDFGFAHKRGFLLWGPPGSGKTSTVSIVINDMVKMGGTVFLGGHPQLLAKALANFRAIEPNRPLVVVWEDIDTVINTFGESSVLSILDGEAQVENVVFIATTNYPEHLDGRIVNRPSRFDKIVKIGMPNAAAREMYLRSKLDTVVKDGIDLVAKTEGMSIAHIKELIIAVYCQGNSVNDTIDRLSRMKVKPRSDNEGGPLGFRPR